MRNNNDNLIPKNVDNCSLNKFNKEKSTLFPDYTRKSRLITIIPEKFSSIKSICTSAEGKNIYTLNNNIIYHYLCHSSRPKKIIYCDEDNLKHMYISNDGNFLFVTSEKILCILTKSGKTLFKLHGHKDEILKLIIHRNLLISSDVNEVRIWNIKSKKLEIVCKEDELAIKDICFDSNTDLVYISSNTGEIFAFDIHSGRLVYRYNGLHSLCNFKILLMRNRLLAATETPNTYLTFFDKRLTRIVNLYTGPTEINKFMISPDEQYVYASCGNYIWKWAIENEKGIEKYKCIDQVSDFEISPDGSHLIASSNKNIHIWTNSNDPTNKVLNCDSVIRKVKFLNNEILLTHSDNEIKLWDLEKHIPINHITQNMSYGVRSVNISNNGELLFIGGMPSDTSIKAFSLISDGKIYKKYNGHQKTVREMYITKDNSRLFSVSWDGSAKMWSVESGECLRTYIDNLDYSCSIAVDEDKGLLFTGSYLHENPEKNHGIRCYHIETGDIIKRISWEEKLPSSCVVFIHKPFLFYGNNNLISVVDYNDSWKNIKTFKGHEKDIRPFGFDYYNNILYSGDGGDGTVRSWSIEGDRNRVYSGHEGVVSAVIIKDDGLIISSGLDGYLKFWDTEKGLINIIKATSDNEGVWDLEFSKDQETLFAACVDHKVKCYDMTSSNFQLKSILYNLENGFLWINSSNDNCPYFFTDLEDLVIVARIDTKNKQIIEYLDVDDPERQEHIRFYNDSNMVMTNLKHSKQFRSTLTKTNYKGLLERCKEVNNFRKLLE